MKIIITGATGSAGGFLTRYFSSRGHEVIATGRMEIPPARLLTFAKYIQADITKPYKLPDADVCIHAAALSDDKGNWNDFYTTNVLGTKNTAEAASGCQKFIHISSSSVYLPDDRPLTEEMAGKQNNKLLSYYGLSKLKAEEILMKTSIHPSCFILRPRAHYGIGDKMIIPRLLKLEKKNVLYCPGKMKVNISLTNFLNLARAVECCMNSSNTGIHVYNISDDQTYIFIEIIKKLTTGLYHHPLLVKHIPISLIRLMAFFKINGMTNLLVRSFTRNMVLDISKIKSELSYSPVTDLDKSISEISDWVDSIGGVEVLKKAGKELAWKTQ